MMTAMTTVIIMIFMFMPIVPTTMAEAEEDLGMLEGVMTVNTIASKVFTNKIFSIQNDNNQQSSKDIFIHEDDEEEEEVSSFDSLPLLNNNNEPSPMMTRPSLWWWFTKDVLRRTTEGRTQLDEEDNDDEEGTEAEERNTNRGIKVRVGGGSLVEERDREEPTQERLYPKARALTYTRFASSLCVLWRVREAILWWLSLYLVMIITSGE